MPNAALLDMQRIVRLAAEPREAGDTVKAAINRAARRLNIGYRRAYTFWHAYPPDAAVRAAEADHIRAEELRLIARQRIELQTRMAWIEARLNARESGSHGSGWALGTLARSQDSARVSLAQQDADPAVGMARNEGLIPDPRQVTLPC